MITFVNIFLFALQKDHYHGMAGAVRGTLRVPEYGAQQMTLYPATSARHVTSRKRLDSEENNGCWYDVKPHTLSQ